MSTTAGAKSPPLHDVVIHNDADGQSLLQSTTGLSRSMSTASRHQNTAHPTTTTTTTAPNGYFPNYHPDGHPQDPNLAPDLASPYGSLASPLQRVPKFTEEWDASRRGSSIIDGPTPRATGLASTMQRSNSYAGSAVGDRPESQQLSRGNTLKKKPSLKRSSSLRRSSSRRSMKAGSVRSLAVRPNGGIDDQDSAFVCPVPTRGNPTEVLANRFQSWRKILKDLIAYFREIQNFYEHRSKALLKLGNVVNNTSLPPGFLPSGGLEDAIEILRVHNRKAIEEANKARDIEEDVILALTGLRSDLHQKIKEIKNLAGDFKNTVEKETEATRKAVKQLNEILGQAQADPASTTGKQDPYLLRLAVDRQIERQIEEENYLHRAYLNIERSGRDLEAIVVGEVQKAYNAYAGILKREAETALDAVGELRAGPISLPKDSEWQYFVSRDERFVDPSLPLRTPDRIRYQGQDALACQEIRAGLLERKSKYLKSYTAGWYVLSPTHLHEFKSADKTQAPLMSLFLPEQKLGSHSTEGSSSNKFIIKGRQTGSMHRGHTWVFRAESFETMMAWYMDIKLLTESSPEEQSNFVRKHSRSYSRSSQRSASSDGMVDEDDDEPFAPDSAAISRGTPTQDVLPRRPSPGGRFPSDLTVNAERGLQVPQSPASVNSAIFPAGQEAAFDQYQGSAGMSMSRSNSQNKRLSVPAAAAAGGGGLGPRTDVGQYNDGDLGYGSTARSPIDQAPSNAVMVSLEAQEDGVNPYTSEPIARYDSGYDEHHNVDDHYVTGVTRGASSRRADEGATVAANGYNGELQGEPIVRRGRSPGPSVAATHGGVGDGFGTATTTTTMTGKAAPLDKDTRPVFNTVRTDTQPTISNLHIPGEYPKTNAGLR